MPQASNAQTAETVLAGAEPEPEDISIFAEFMLFLRENKKWWLMPIVVTTILLGALVAAGGSPATPFIYIFF